MTAARGFMKSRSTILFGGRIKILPPLAAE